jgi:hypothetical protein
MLPGDPPTRLSPPSTHTPPPPPHTLHPLLPAQRVWDYVNDSYVHRLIQSKTDGKLVEVRLCRQAAVGVLHLYGRTSVCLGFGIGGVR